MTSQKDGARCYTRVRTPVLTEYARLLFERLPRQARGVPVYTFKATLYCMYIKYISSTSAAVQEIAVVLMGPLSNILVFLGTPHTPVRQPNGVWFGTGHACGHVSSCPCPLVCLLAALTLAGWGMVKSVGQIPDSTSKAIAAFGIATLLDPLLVFLVDVAASHYNCSQVRYLEPTVELKGPRGVATHGLFLS